MDPGNTHKLQERKSRLYFRTEIVAGQWFHSGMSPVAQAMLEGRKGEVVGGGGSGGEGGSGGGATVQELRQAMSGTG